MAGTIAEGKTLPTVILRQIVEKTDGVPLFVEEMTKAILESEVVRTRRSLRTHRGGGGGDHSDHAARCPHGPAGSLGHRQSLAQLGAVIGRQFPYALVRADRV